MIQPLTNICIINTCYHKLNSYSLILRSGFYTVLTEAGKPESWTANFEEKVNMKINHIVQRRGNTAQTFKAVDSV